MNDAELEKNLRYLLRPAEPASDLRQRIAQELSADEAGLQEPARSPTLSATPGFLFRLLRDFGWACAGAAVVLAVLILVPRKHGVANSNPTLAAHDLSPAAAGAAAFEHDESTHELVSAENSDQLVETDDGPAREVRYSYVERHAWSNPQTGARVVLEVPREDVYLLPVSLE